MSNKCYPLRHVAHIMSGATRLLIEIDNKVNIKKKKTIILLMKFDLYE